MRSRCLTVKVLSRRMLPISRTYGKGIFSVYQCGTEIAHKYQCTEQAEYKCYGLQWNEDDHCATSGGMRGKLRLTDILAPFLFVGGEN
jgi:hypothetical protein